MKTRPIAIRLTNLELAKAYEGLIDSTTISVSDISSLSKIVKLTCLYGIMCLSKDHKAPPRQESINQIDSIIADNLRINNIF